MDKIQCCPCHTDESIYCDQCCECDRPEILSLKASHADLGETVRWMAQTIHQAYHIEQLGTFLECPKNTCDAAKQALRRAQEIVK